MVRAALLLVLIFLAPDARADDEIKCNDAGNMLEMGACASDRFNAADAELNAAYQALLVAGAKEPRFLEQLRKTQRLWIQFRDAAVDTRFACDKGDDRLCWGSMLSIKRPDYKTQLTRERTAQLVKLLASRYPAREKD